MAVGFLKSIIPGAKNLLGVGKQAWSSASGAFKAAQGSGIGTRLTQFAAGGREQMRLSWKLAEGVPGAQQSMRNAGIALAAGGGLLALNRGAAEARRG